MVFCAVNGKDILDHPLSSPEKRSTLSKKSRQSRRPSKSINQSINQSNNQSTNRPTNQPINQSSNQSLNRGIQMKNKVLTFTHDHSASFTTFQAGNNCVSTKLCSLSLFVTHTAISAPSAAREDNGIVSKSESAR